MPSRTYVYVDSFNLYYGCLKGTPYKWLDLNKLCQLYLPASRIERIYYCTAIVSGTADDPDNHIRQRAYLRALQTLPNIRIILGHFLSERIELPRADGNGSVAVIRSKEKGSDVNLVTALMWDACEDNFDTAAIVSGDLDFVSPVKTVRDNYRKEIIVLDPQRKSGGKSKLYEVASSSKPIRTSALAASQFLNELTDRDGRKIHKPPEWYVNP